MTRNFWMKQSSRQENIIYLVMWAILFVSPILSMYISIVAGERSSFEWHDLWFVWQKFLVFLGLFLIHNFLLAPILINRHHKVGYFSLITVVVACFALYQCTTRPERPGPRHEPIEQQMPPEGPGMPPEGLRKKHEVPRTPNASGVPEAPKGATLRPAHGPKHDHVRPPVIVGERDIVATVILILMFGMNLGIKAYSKSRNDQRKLAELEKQNVEQQLEYLKYQINPHFFMNTLNNIHALVDIDPKKAQETILELSKMMRFILYEGDKNGVPLSREMEFIRTYINLMRLRYTDRVTISVELPTEVPDKTIPPLMLISFVENAFKHGVSYQHPSFIYIKVDVDSKLTFTCQNSKAEKPNQEKGGMGLVNVRKRLDLLYDKNYTLNIDDAPNVYSVKLVIPLNRKLDSELARLSTHGAQETVNRTPSLLA